MGEVAGGMNNIGRSAMESNRQTGYLSNQLRAMGTTLRYLVAGNVIFGGFGLVKSLSQIQTQMAMITTLAPQMNFTTGSLHAFFDELQQGSNASLTPVDQLGESTINLLSSVQLQGTQKSELARMVTDLGEGAQLAQTPVDELTKAVTGMIQAFGLAPTRNNMDRFIRDYVTLIRRAPGGPAAGQQIIQQLAPLAAVSRLARVTPQQMFGLMTTGLRFGGTPSTAGRGIQFLLQSIAAPHHQERGALAQAGVTPEFVQQFGGVAAIRAVIRHAQRLGVQGAGVLRSLPDEQLDALDTAGMSGLRDLGISGQGIEWLQKAIGRIHGVRAIITLLTQMQTGEGAGNFAEDIKAADRAFRGIGREGVGIEEQFKDFARQQPLRAAGIALHNMALQAPRALEGVINPIARQVARGGIFATNHPHGTRRVMEGAAVLMAALGIGRGIRGGLGAASGFFGQRFVQERAITAATDPTRAGMLGGSPQNPMFVVVVGQLFGGATAGPGGGTTPPGFLGGRLGRLGRFRGLGRVGLGLGLAEGAAVAGATYGAMKLSDIVTPQRGKDYSFGDLGHDTKRFFSFAFANGQNRNERQANAIARANERSGEIARLNRTLAPFHRRDPLYGVTAIYSQRREMIHGKAEVVLDVNLSTAEGVKRKRIHVPMDIWKNGTTPSQRGQPGKTKGNIP